MYFFGDCGAFVTGILASGAIRGSDPEKSEGEKALQALKDGSLGLWGSVIIPSTFIYQLWMKSPANENHNSITNSVIRKVGDENFPELKVLNNFANPSIHNCWGYLKTGYSHTADYVKKAQPGTIDTLTKAGAATLNGTAYAGELTWKATKYVGVETWRYTVKAYKWIAPSPIEVNIDRSINKVRLH